MATGYTREQLHALAQQMEENIPPPQSAADLKGAVKAKDISTAGTDLGVLLRIGFKNGNELDFFLNCPVAVDFLYGLYAAGRTHDWWAEPPQETKHRLELPTPEDLAAALPVISLRTDSDPKGLLVSFSGGPTVFQFFMPKNIAAEMLAQIHIAAERAGWWDSEMRLIPVGGEKLQ